MPPFEPPSAAICLGVATPFAIAAASPSVAAAGVPAARGHDQRRGREAGQRAQPSDAHGCPFLGDTYDMRLMSCVER